MRLLHTSDWHFGKNAAAINDYSEEQTFFLEQLKEIIEGEKVDAVLCAGDIYDSGKVSGEAIELYSRAANTICHDAGTPMVVIAGNHDSAERLAACDQLLAGAGLYIHGRLARSLKPVLFEGGKVAVYALPFFQPGEAAAVLQDPSIRTMTEAMTAILDRIRENMDPAACNILMAHLSVSGAELSESDRSAINGDTGDGHMIGGSSSVKPELFHGFDYVALGHIHKPQQLADNICYSGSPVKYSFGREEKQQKGVWIFDTEDRSLHFCPLQAKHDRLTLTCTYAEAIARTDLKDTYLRLELTDCLATMEIQSDMRQRFPYLMEFRGRQPEDNGGRTSLSDSDVQNLSDDRILTSFLRDLFNEEPEADLMDLFMTAMGNVEKEELQ